MKFAHRTRGIVGAIAVVMSLALPLMLTLSSAAEARIGGRSSMGSRGARTFSAPPKTNTAPSAAQPFNRTITQPGTAATGAAGAGAAAKGGMFNRPGMGMLGGLAAGFLGAGLLGMLFGGGMFSGLGGLSSIIGLILQIGLIVIVARLAMSWWQRRKQGAASPAYANNAAGPATGPAPSQQAGFGSGFGFGSNAPAAAPLEIGPADYEKFEQLLGEIQAAWSDEDIGKLHELATPEMVSYFSADLAENKKNNDINKVSDVKLLQGDLAEAWREGETDYASVAMRFSLIDKTLERGTNRLVDGSETPIEATEVWTFARRRGSDWELSAIQQTGDEQA
ncbi:MULTISPECIES: Tim44 domain-containing protein [Rhodopseudomonas]|uniref:Membrane protein n=1 Tax=Rhodopseudomonas palustris TaxID=1076 RepID=A0A0D7E0Z8_RHOPL|nr:MULTISPECIES: TIM44-like domain-containing protein [Rhodopseudomonas]KIZ33327.1 membrane protein [Rhodopseudomonas palustris]WOK20241.1 TIM44-like domain-containing protein [Rhodopseudomonas sp. BAL398]